MFKEDEVLKLQDEMGNDDYRVKLLSSDGHGSITSVTAAYVEYIKDGETTSYICIWRDVSTSYPQERNGLTPTNACHSIPFSIHEEDCLSYLEVRTSTQSMTIAGGLTYQIKLWLFDCENRIRYFEVKTKSILKALQLNQNGTLIASIESQNILIRNNELNIISCIMSRAEVSTPLTFIDDRLGIVSCASDCQSFEMHSIQESTTVVTNSSTKGLVISAMHSHKDRMIVGYIGGRCSMFRMIENTAIDMIEMSSLDLAKEMRFSGGATGLPGVISSNSFDPIQISYLDAKSVLVILTSTMLVFIDEQSFKICDSVLLNTLGVSLCPLQSGHVQTSIPNDDYTAITAVLLPHFTPKISVINFNINLKEVDDSSNLSFFISTEAVEESALLRSQISPPVTPAKHRDALDRRHPARVAGQWEKPLVLKGKLVDQPVTFHSRIKSSGYGKPQADDFYANRKLKLEREGRLRRSRSASGGGMKASAGRSGSGVRIRGYDTACGPMTRHQSNNDLNAPLSPLPLFRLRFNGDGSSLAAAGAQTAVSVLRLPVHRHKGDGTFFMGHDSKVTGVCFSHDRTLVLSSSADGTARVWKDRPDSSAVLLSHYEKQPDSIMTSKRNSLDSNMLKSSSLQAMGSTRRSLSTREDRNKPFATEINHAEFFFMDKFIVLAVKSSVLLYTYDIEEPATNDLKRLRCPGRYLRVHYWSHGDCQGVTALACMNTVQSPLVISSTSDRKLFVLDACSGKIARVIDSPHEKAIHCISLPSPSIHSQLSSEAYNTFCTSAIDNAIVLWDLRAPQATSRITSHINRREEIGCALSPCMRYLATGSEDRCARLFDIRSTRELCKLPGHKDVVSDVAFNPLFSQLATCSFDGTVRFYADPESPVSQFEYM